MKFAKMIRKIQHNVSYTIEEMQQKFGTNYKEHRFFKAQILKIAINEINEKSDIFVELIEHKKSKVVDKISFRVTQKSMEEGDNIEESAENTNITTEKIARFYCHEGLF